MQPRSAAHSFLRRHRRAHATLLLWLTATLLPPSSGTAAAPASSPPPTGGRPSDDEAVVLSPFEVVADNRGYLGVNTTSGTRLNSKLEDLAAAISVVTKEQMEDFGLLDQNDIFNYEANTEGTGNFTDFSINLSGMPIDNVQLDPQSANRIRGLNTANTTFGNFETTGRVPIDPSNIDAVEISRGPNASLFGIGNPAGSVNSVPASAHLRRNSATAAFRADSRDGWRTSLDFNRVLRPDRLAVRGSVVRQHDGFTLKPAGVDTLRLNGMAKFRPFVRTTISGSYSYYRAHGNRPNAVPPRDGISGWLAAGSPTWDPVTSTAKINGAVVGTFAGAANPPYFATAQSGMQAYIDQTGLAYLGMGRTTGSNNPLNQNQNIRLVTATADPTGFLAAQPLLQDYPVLANKALYDWSAVNIAAQNRFEDKAHTMSVLLEQTLLNTGRQTLGLQFGWFRELSDRYTRNLLGSLSPAQGFAAMVSIDVNERMLDGQPNPWFLRPFVGLVAPVTVEQPIDRDTWRAQLAYRLDLRREAGRRRWLGLHQLSGYAEYKNIESLQVSYRDAIVSNHAWSDTTTVRGGGIGPYQLYHRFYMGDNLGRNIDYAPTAFRNGASTLRWGSGLTQQFVSEPVQVGTVVSNSSNTTGGQSNQWTILKSQGAILQSFLLRDRLVTTFGVREDQRYSRRGGTPAYLDGLTLDYGSFHRWQEGDWAVGQGRTTTAGAVLKPLPWLSLHGNKSSSFQPAGLAYSLYRRILPDPSGEGRDFGFSLTLLGERLVVRVNRYKTIQINSRNGDSANIAQRAYRLDFASTTSNQYNLQRQATLWLTAQAQAQGQTLSPAQLNQRLAEVMKLPLEFVESNPPSASAVDDLTARGTEIEAHLNPTRHWTMRLNVTQQEAINSGLAAEVGQWVSERAAVWPTIVDPRVNRPFFTEPYGGSTALSYYTTNVLTPLQVAQAMQGKSRPQVREWRANFLTNFRLAGLTDQRFLRRFSVGGAVRWEDQGAIGFRGVQQLPAIITALDPNQPIWDRAHTYFDANLAYRTRILSDRVSLTVTLNVRNLTEGGRLQPIAVEATGVPNAYRIIDPRLFILTATFGL